MTRNSRADQKIGVPESLDFAIRVEEVGNITYVGYAKPGSDTSEPVWRIKKLVETSTDLTITYPDGNDYFDNRWDDRATLNYS